MSLTEQRTGAVAAALAKDRLGVPSVVFFVISAAAPLTVVAGVVGTAYAVTGVTGVPLAFLVLGAILAVFAVGYVTMARHVVNAGAFYAYTAQGLGRPLGVATAWVALLAYNALQVGLYGLIASAADPLLVDWFGVSLDWWVVALVAWALTGALGLTRVDLNGRVLAVLLIAEIAIVVVFDIANLTHPAASGYSAEGLTPSSLFMPGLGALIAVCVAAFSGFESSVVFSEESKDARRTVPVATYVALAVIAGLYAVSSWAVSVSVGPDQVVEASKSQGTALLFDLAGRHLGPAVATAGSALFVTSIVAALIAFHNTIARYVFALGRERVLPAVFGRTSVRTGAPLIGSVTQSVVGLAVIAVYAFAGLDPLVDLLFTSGAFGGFGVLLLLAGTSVAVLLFFARTPGTENAWRTKVAPAAAAVLLFVVLGLALTNFDVVLGVEPSSPLRWILPGAYVVAIALGVLWGLALRARRPDVYAHIGLGARAAIGEGR
ncbi:amino acid permease [Sphaerisporangium krabiense]|uniref:Amino acid transporter n=1 Tax=Sphaerisporangium krabiense TaxID=763782 RepID=A0A7W8Z9Z4_9ACTN|nr:APC family permease [Sphaerisporangium krabiense]MBB5630138.1 amino acid transporter [Sphaerisporangium krabiense]GII65089.1 amino acid permease [Sphaerisporangium krabiense]